MGFSDTLKTVSKAVTAKPPSLKFNPNVNWGGNKEMVQVRRKGRDQNPIFMPVREWEDEKSPYGDYTVPVRTGVLNYKHKKVEGVTKKEGPRNVQYSNRSSPAPSVAGSTYSQGPENHSIAPSVTRSERSPSSQRSSSTFQSMPRSKISRDSRHSSSRAPLVTPSAQSRSFTNSSSRSSLDASSAHPQSSRHSSHRPQSTAGSARSQHSRHSSPRSASVATSTTSRSSYKSGRDLYN